MDVAVSHLASSTYSISQDDKARVATDQRSPNQDHRPSLAHLSFSSIVHHHNQGPCR